MIKHAIAFVVLTLLTQLGGIAWLLALALRPVVGRFLLLFIALYIAITVAAHYVAPLTGRVALPCLDAGPAQIAVLNPLYCALNRNYVTPPMKQHADALAAQMHEDFPGTRTRALDASFPFFDGLPLLPHLSHSNGRQLDLAYYYTDEQGDYALGRARWFMGYWAFEEPASTDLDPCADNTGLSLRWDMDWFQDYTRPFPLDEARTGAALRWLAENPVGTDYKVLIEPHIAARLNVSADTVRFQGCNAARHDDHMHVQFQ